MTFDFLIVGAGFSGSVLANKLAEHGKKVLLIDKRSHIGGNAYDTYDQNGVLIHKYGPHIFHTNSKIIFEFLSQFTSWKKYEHRVLAKVDDKLLPIPINLDTVNRLYNLQLNENQLAQFFENVRIPKEEILNSEDVIISQVGIDLYEKFFKFYTKKQWGIFPSELHPSVTSRIPIRTNNDPRYFTDTYQFMPTDGFTPLFKNLISNKNITLELDCDFKTYKLSNYKHLIFSGPIDTFYKHSLGPLPYRSLRFEHKHVANCNYFQEVGTINYPNDFDYTRITEFKHLTQQKHSGTSIVKEYPVAEGDPYYPIPQQENIALYKKYLTLSLKDKHVSFIGRLGEYKYYNMDQAVGAALSLAGKFLGKSFLQ